MKKLKVSIFPVAIIAVLISTLSLAPSFAQVVDRSVPLKKLDGDFVLADGPSWDDSSALYIPDVKGETIYRYIPKTNTLAVVKKNIGRISASYYNHGKLYLSDNGNSRICEFDIKSHEMKILATHSEQTRPNDLIVDNDGGVYYTLTRQGQVMYVGSSENGKASIVVEKIQTPNGIAISPDEGTLYVSAATPKEIWAFNIKSNGELSKGQLFAKMDDGPDRAADGMTVDRAGNVYCAGPKHVWIWTPSGKLIEKIETPQRPINCAFGGQRMRTLYITCFDGVYQQEMKVCGRSSQPSQDPLDPRNKKSPSKVTPFNVISELDVPYAQYGDRKLLLDLSSPSQQASGRPAVIVVHGGGWLNGDKSKFRALAVELARRGFVTAAIEYRLGGESRFPAGIHDCNAATRYLRANAKKLGIDPQRIGAVGGSAGGHLVGLMATGWQEKKLQGDGGHAEQSSRLQAAIVMAGPLQMLTGSVADKSRNQPDASNANKWLGKTIDEAPELYKLASPFDFISKDSPPILFMVGEHDQPQRNEPAREKLRKYNVWTDVKIYQGGKHGCWNQLPWFNEMVEDMNTFFKKQL